MSRGYNLKVWILLASSTVCSCQYKEARKPDNTLLARQCVEQLVQNNFTGVVKFFGAAVKAVLPAEQIEDVWKTLVTLALSRGSGARDRRSCGNTVLCL